MINYLISIYQILIYFFIKKNYNIVNLSKFNYKFFFIKKNKFILISIFLIIILSIFFCCQTKKYKYRVIDSTKKPLKKILNAKIIEKDSGKIKYIIFAPLIKEYLDINNNLIIFPNGIFIKFFNKKNNKTATLQAKYAKIIEHKKYYEAKKNVIIISPLGDTILTESIFYFQNKDMLFTYDTVKIIGLNGSVIFANHGLEISNNFSCYKLFENKNSKIRIKN